MHLKIMLAVLMMCVLVGCDAPKAEQPTPSPVIANTLTPKPSASILPKKNTTELLAELKTWQKFGMTLDRSDSKACEQNLSKQTDKLLETMSSSNSDSIALAAGVSLPDCLKCNSKAVNQCEDLAKDIADAEAKLKSKPTK